MLSYHVYTMSLFRTNTTSSDAYDLSVWHSKKLQTERMSLRRSKVQMDYFCFHNSTSHRVTTLNGNNEIITCSKFLNFFGIFQV